MDENWETISRTTIWSTLIFTIIGLKLSQTTKRQKRDGYGEKRSSAQAIYLFRSCQCEYIFQWSVSNSINDFTPSTTSSPPGLRKMNRDAYFSDKFGPEIYKSLTEDVWGALLDKMNFFSMVSFSYRWSQILSQSSTCLVKILTGVRKTSPWK